MPRKILVIQPISEEALAAFADRPDIRVEVLRDTSPAAIIAAIADAEGVTIRDALLPVEAIEAAPSLRVVSRHGVGYDNIPLEHCTQRGIPVTVIGPVNTVAVAEHALFLMLAVAKRGAHFDRAMRAGDFAIRSRFTTMELRGRTLSIIGFGRIGQELAARARALGMAIAAFDPMADPAAFPDVTFHPSLNAALAVGNVVSLHVPLTQQTKGVIDHAALALMPAGSIIINTARGGIIDEAALIESIDRGHLRGAGLDVFAHEPLPLGDPLLECDEIVVSPHNAALSAESLVGMGRATVANVLAAFDGRLDRSLVVNPAVFG